MLSYDSGRDSDLEPRSLVVFNHKPLKNNNNKNKTKENMCFKTLKVHLQNLYTELN